MLERYKDSLSDLVHLLKVDPKNTAAQREIEVVKDYWRKVQIMYIYTKEKIGKSREGWVHIVNCSNMKLLVISGIKSHANNRKVYCTYISLEFWNMMLGNSSAILYSFYVQLGHCFEYFYALVLCYSFTTKRFTVPKIYKVLCNIHCIIKSKTLQVQNIFYELSLLIKFELILGAKIPSNRKL